jgi:type IV secretion system protein TrbG
MTAPRPCIRKAVLPALLVSALALSACATNKPPQISYDDPRPAVLQAEPPKPVQIVEIPQPLPLPGQLKPVTPSSQSPEPRDPAARVNLANAAARVQPVRDGFINAVQVYPFSTGALYQVYTAPGQITDIALQPGAV